MVSFKDITGALGTILGYLGAEVAEESVFERLLWPQRYYNDFSPTIFLKFVFLMPSGGPLHRAALETLTQFQKNGLYLGKTRGNMLGSAFYSRLDVSYFARTLTGQENAAKESRNGFLVRISRSLAHSYVAKQDDKEKILSALVVSKRAYIPLHRVYLKCCTSQTPTPSGTVVVSEDKLTWKCFVGVVASESIAIAAAVIASVYTHTTWLCVYFVLPLLFKVFSFGTNVRRESLRVAVDGESEVETIFELDDLNHGLVLIQGPDHVVRQFCRHYGHPIRGSDVTANRMRETMSMSVVYLFVGYFPAGLIALLWLDDDAQVLWLSYQLYVVFVMHISRLLGLNECGRTEERIARHLKKGREVMLSDSTGPLVIFRVETVWFENVTEGRRAMSDTIAAHKRLCKSNGEAGRAKRLAVQSLRKRLKETVHLLWWWGCRHRS
ncbi:unnamed protein product [Aureobasidium vineae]|uniref:Uncharacterized protein n=1 Tax=Aureobasidium vineae TaxID=2773715 RepID=A0A9N8JMY8_9PEZI|nr:unnamed protein product [Aureobasidium vineae]